MTRSLPTAIEAERAILGAFLLDGSLLAPYIETLSPMLFHNDACGLIWATMQTLHRAGHGVDVLTVRSELRRRNAFIDVGIDTFLAILEEEGTVATQIPTYVDLLRDAATRRTLYDLGRSLTEGATNGQPVDALLDTLRTYTPTLPPRPAARLRTAAQVMTDPPPIAVIAGVAWQHGVTVLVSESGAGKTFVLLDMAAAVSQGQAWHGREVRHGSVAYVSFEGDALGLRLRGLREAGRALDHLYVIDQVDDPLSPRVDRDGNESPSAGELAVRDKLADLMNDFAPPLTLLIVDTVRASLVGSENMSDVIAAYLRATRRLLAPYPEAAAILAHHAGWQDGETDRKRERGSSALRGNVDGTLYLEVVEENLETGVAALSLTARKVRDSKKPPVLRLLRTSVTLATRDDRGWPETTCRIEPDPRTAQEISDEEARVRAGDEAALDQRAYAVLAQGDITSIKTLRLLLGVQYGMAEAAVARLMRAGRIRPPAKQRTPYTVVTA
jgi:hypothetical protein